MAEFTHTERYDGIQMVTADLVMAEVAVRTAPVDTPTLTLTGGSEEAWDVSSNGGELRVGMRPTVVTIGSVTISGSHISISHIKDGVVIIGGDSGDRDQQRISASIELPPDYQLSGQRLQTVSGKIVAKDVTSANNLFKTVSGKVEIDGLRADNLYAQSVSGNIALGRIVTRRAEARSVSGDVVIRDSSATDGWECRTVSGDIDTRGSQGYVRARSTSGIVHG